MKALKNSSAFNKAKFDNLNNLNLILISKEKVEISTTTNNSDQEDKKK